MQKLRTKWMRIDFSSDTRHFYIIDNSGMGNYFLVWAILYLFYRTIQLLNLRGVTFKSYWYNIYTLLFGSKHNTATHL